MSYLSAEKQQLKDLAAAVDQVWHKRLASGSPVQAALQQDQVAVDTALDEWVETQVVQHDEKKCAQPQGMLACAEWHSEDQNTANVLKPCSQLHPLHLHLHSMRMHVWHVLVLSLVVA